MESHGYLEPARLLRVLGWALPVGALGLAVGLLAPHEYDRYDTWFWVVAGLLLVFAAGAHAVARRGSGVSPIWVHAASLVLSAITLVLTWLTMPDVGGIDAIFLFLPLAVSASFGPAGWVVGIFAFQVAGYAVVLATSSDRLGFDKPTQWGAVVAALLVGAVYFGMVRRELARRHAAFVGRAGELQRLNQRLLDTDEMRARFLANAAHELRTPLTSVYGFSATLVDRWEELDEGMRQQMAGTIRKESARMSRLVDDLLTLSKIEAGAVTSHPEVVDLRAAVGEVAVLAGLGVPTITGDARVEALVDPDHLRQILLNYVTNAHKYGEEPITFELGTDGDSVFLHVCDAGPGVPHEFVPHLFTRFTRGTAEAAKDGGTGLGLSIAKGLAQAEHGDAWYEPNEPRGARFCLRLPAAKDRP